MLALEHARLMASETRTFHSVDSYEELQDRLCSNQAVAENVQRGKSVLQMHKAALGSDSIMRADLLGDYTEFGMGTHKGMDGKLYLCQLFRKSQ